MTNVERCGATDVERRIARSLKRTDDALNASPLDLLRTRDAFCDLQEQVMQLLEERIPQLQLEERDWSVALLETARADLQAAETLASQGCQDCPAVLCMLLQMVFEKLAKAALARVDVQRFRALRRSHAVVSRFIDILKRERVYQDLHYRWKDVFPVIRMLERAHPAIAKKGPHLEYPFETAVSPSDNPRYRMALPTELPVVREFEDLQCARARGLRVLRFARELCNRFDEFF